MAKHTLIAYVEDVPGVLNRVASLFRRRNFNIESLTVGGTDQPGVSRLTVVVEASEAGARIVEANLYKLVNVLRVDDLTHKASLTRELGLVKVKVSAETRAQVLQLVEVFRSRVDRRRREDHHGRSHRHAGEDRQVRDGHASLRHRRDGPHRLGLDGPRP